MKLIDWVSSLTKGSSELFLYISLWLVGIPSCIYIVFLLWPLHFSSEGSTTEVRFSQAERWIEPLKGFSFDTAGFKALSRRPPNFGQVKWTSIALPDTETLPAISALPDDPAMAVAWIRVHYTPSTKQELGEMLAIYDARIMGGACMVWVNGKLVFTNIDDWHMQWNKPMLASFSSGASPGTPVEIVLAIPFRLAQGYAVGSLYAGKLSIMQQRADVRYFWQQTLPRGGILITLLLGFFSFQFWLGRRSEMPHLLLALASVAWFICDLQYFIDFEDATASKWLGSLDDSALSWAVLLSFLFAFRIADKSFPRFEKAAVLYSLMSTLITLPLWNWQVFALVLQHYGDLMMGIGLACLFSVIAIRDSRFEIKVVAVSLWSIVLFGAIDLICLTSQRYPDGIHLFPYAPFLLFGAFMFSIQRRYFGALSSVEKLNQSLNDRLLEREQELEIKHKELLEIERQQTTLLEQQRLIREMHDGIGSTLISSLVLAERKLLPPERLASILRDCIDELKLVIDSIEPFDQDIVAMLATVRNRLGKRIEDAGIHVIWNMEDLPPLPWLGQAHVLQVLRIMQESLTNILKHARASEIQISASRAETASGKSMLLVRISDNGIGYSFETIVRGRGLKSMKARTKQINGELLINTCVGGGTVVELWLPTEIEESVSP